jgi:hypothetical protein
MPDYEWIADPVERWVKAGIDWAFAGIMTTTWTLAEMRAMVGEGE